MLQTTRLLTLRSLLSLLGIVPGVAGLLAIGATNRTALAAVTRLMQDTSDRASLVVAGAETDGEGVAAALLPRLHRNRRTLPAAGPGQL